MVLANNVLGGGNGGYTEGARVYRATDQVIVAAVLTAIIFSTVRWDNDNIFDLAGNPTRLTCKTTGKYNIFGHINWQLQANKELLTLLRLNGSTSINTDGDYSTQAVYLHRQNINTVYDLVTGDYLELMVRHQPAGNIAVKAYPNFSPEFMIQRIG